MKKHNKLLKYLFYVMMLSLFASICLSTAQTDSNRLSLDAANNAVNHTLNDLLDAEKAGVDVTDLVGQLNIAVGFLADAENAERRGDTKAVDTKTDAAVSIARHVSAVLQQRMLVKVDLVSVLVLAIIGIILSILVLFVVWRFIKRSYNRMPLIEPRGC